MVTKSNLICNAKICIIQCICKFSILFYTKNQLPMKEISTLLNEIRQATTPFVTK